MDNKERQQAGNWAERVTLPRGNLERELFFSEFEPETFEEKVYAAEKAKEYQTQEGGEELAYANWN